MSLKQKGQNVESEQLGLCSYSHHGAMCNVGDVGEEDTWPLLQGVWT